MSFNSIFEGLRDKQSLPVKLPEQQERPGIRRRLSSLSLKLNIHSSSLASATWELRRSKSVSSMGDYAGSSLRKLWNWGLGWIAARKATFGSDLEFNGGENASQGIRFHSVLGSWYDAVHKVTSQLRRKLARTDNVGLPQTCRYDSVGYSKNFDGGRTPSFVVR